VEAAIGWAICGKRPFDGIDAGKRRRLVFEPPEKPVKVCRLAPCPNHDAFGIVPNLAGEPAIPRQAPHRGTKTDALHKPPHADRPPFPWQNGCGSRHRHHMFRILK
jgi:hypothetical protein